MLKQSSFENIHYWQVARSYFGKSLYVTGFFLVGDTLIDCGPANALPILQPVFRDLPIQKMLITHHHEDHTGNAHFLQNTGNVEVFAQERASELLEEVHQSIPVYRRIIWGRPQPVKMSVLNEICDTGKHELEIIPTPGHAEDHVCLYIRKKKWLFTGDLFLSTYLRYLRDDENIYVIMASLRKLIELRPAMVFCNHRGFIPAGSEALSRKLSFLESIRDQVLANQEKGIPLKISADKLLKKDHFFRMFSFGEFSSENLVRAFVDQKGFEA